MRVLAIDTSSRRRVLAVMADGPAVLGQRSEAAVERLPAALAALVTEHGAPEAVVVAAGPGSYTGVRAGMAAAVGVAHARGLPLHTAGSLEVVAHAAPAAAVDVLVVADAGRGGAYVARFRRRGSGGALEQVEEPRRVDAATLAVPDGADAVALDPPPGHALAQGDAAVALAAAAVAAVSRPPVDLDRLQPVYVGAASGRSPGPRV